MNDERVLSVAEARAIDVDAVQRLGMPSLLLMENAARSVAEVARALGERFVILCGAGNNGGDGLAVARHLGFVRCAVHLLAMPDPQKAPDAAVQATILQNAGAKLLLAPPPDPTTTGDAVWIDALFGTGLDRPLREPALGWVETFNRAGGPRLSVDIPSGLHGDTGAVLGLACRADVTVTFVAKKRGMLTATGRAHCGRVEVVGLGLP
ncbi:MAG: NAD(P)H-hydrate epimerase [Planctomycetes bacterium]|nr:NAD(P)H-hydrate epimerase [Planctomycetota bacterium]